MAAARKPSLLELLGEAIRAVLRAREDEHLAPIAGADEPRQQAALLALVGEVHGLLDLLGRCIALADFDADGCVEHLARELANVVGERRREQQVLPALRQQRDDAANVGQEAHVEHAVGFVEHEDLDVPQIESALLRVIEQPTRCARRARRCRGAAESICGLMLTPPKITADFSGRYLP